MKNNHFIHLPWVQSYANQALITPQAKKLQPMQKPPNTSPKISKPNQNEMKVCKNQDKASQRLGEYKSRR